MPESESESESEPEAVTSPPVETAVPVTPPAPPWATVTPREVLMLFTAGWLGGLGALSLLGPHQPWPARVFGLAEVVSAILWFVPGRRVFGFGAMLAVLAVAALRQIIAGQLPGVVIFYAVVVAYLAIEDGALKLGPAEPEAAPKPDGA